MKRFKQAKDIKVGVIGYGGAFNMGRGHLREMMHAGMTPTAVVDVDKERLKVAQEDFPGIETYASVSEMLRKSDVHLLAIITPHNTHAKLAIQCLNAGRHVVCEKPFAITTAECDAMIAAAKKNKVMLSTYHNRHWDGCILQALKTIRSGAIGDVVRVEAHGGGYGKPGDWWRSSKSISGGILYDWGVHMLEYMLQIVNSEIVEVTGFAKTGFWAPQTAWKEDTNEDEGFAVIRFKNGTWGSLCITQIDSNPKRGMIEVTGTKGSYLFDGGWFEVYTHSGKDTVIRKGQNPPSEWWAFYQNIAEHLTKGTPLVITPEWARRPIHILDLANQSARKGKALPAKYR
ncbi:MAG TPA: Gfo/Idh/MocA family oxidoreductase [Candidatus Hydrogenedentes bacterium]|nr:Gfo/Idh/MocA family oxidoreductase [Candidatus Hydrogenedentota bacterium]HOL77879.1 Gfo/Idh/MocA family oxidoreductase [Candidatus Hydrogenedentota bacterium]HPO87044.1 Gfo/Idh/MocA family oxidoreductase [Candidatus Hydrogenedentota bacterium]